MAYLYAVQEFCDNHGIIQTSGKELEQMTGYPYRKGGRALGELSWTLVKAERGNVRKKNGSFKIFSRGESAQGKKILARFNEHFRKVLEGLDK